MIKINTKIKNNQSSFGVSRLAEGIQALIVAFFLIASTVMSQAQVDCNIIMVCNDNIQVSLGENCTEILSVDMLLEDPTYPDVNYSVTLWRENGDVVADNVLRESMIGELLSARIKLNGCDISCWGNLTVEDKLPPTITNCQSPIEVECEESLFPGVNVPRPTAFDACGGVDFDYSDVTEKLDCAQPYTMTVTRSWIATDDYGNTATCEQIINVNRASIDDVTFPDDLAGPTALECGAAIPYLPNGAPSPDFTGYPTGVECPNINYYYDDVIFDLCGAGVKVLRTWNVLDWCSGRDTSGNQVIKVLDTRAPVCTSQPDFFNTIPTDEGKCTGTYTVPPPIVELECSAWDYIVGYKIRDANGQPLDLPIYDNVDKITNPDGSYFYRIKDLPQDTSWIVYTIEDACGHKTQCFTEVFVEDQEKPTAICEGYTIVTLGTDGWADVSATSIDDHSKDNCEIEKYEVKRQIDNCGFPSNLVFDEKVKFCCEDVSEDANAYIKVVLRVHDAFGNYSDCVANVKVEDKIYPLITYCPPNATVECEEDRSPAKLGTATAVDNCDVMITFSDNENGLNKCGKGNVTRTWTARDPGNKVANCRQTITVQDSNPFGKDNINFPRDITINGCSKTDADPLLINSFPTYTNTECTEIAVSYDDVEFTANDACKKIQRTWRLADWCDFNASNSLYFESVQTITLINNQGPTFVSNCSDKTIESLENDCEEYVEHRAEATDDCTAPEKIKYRWELDENNNGIINRSGTGAIVGDVYPAGTHRFTFYATDECDNETRCSYRFTVQDGKAPTPICHRELVITLDADGDAEIWAEDFNLKSYDLCTGEDDLTFAFNASGSERVKYFNCSDVPNGVASLIELEMFVFDADGNSEYCSVKLELQDSKTTDACTDDPFANGRIAGNVMHHTSEGLVDVDVRIVDMNSNANNITITDNDGHFEFGDAKFYNTYSVKPESNDDLLNGVSTLDLVHIQRHILDIEAIEIPTNLIAADINADNKVSAADLVALRKVILGITNEYQNNNSWRFVPSTHEFQDSTYPWGFPEEISIYDLLIDKVDSDFTSIKVGDVNNSSKANLRSIDTENRSGGTYLLVDNNNYSTGDIISVPVYASEYQELYGMQMSMEWNDSDLQFLGVESNSLIIKDGTFSSSKNGFKISIVEQSILELNKEDILFTLMFEAKSSSDLASLSLSQEGMSSELYDTNLDVSEIELVVRTDVYQGAAVEVVQNAPNPFSLSTEVAVTMDEEGPINVTVYDLSGAKVYQQSTTGNIGTNRIVIQRNDLNDKAGVYFFHISSQSKLFTGKMIMVD